MTLMITAMDNIGWAQDNNRFLPFSEVFLSAAPQTDLRSQRIKASMYFDNEEADQ